MLKLIRIDGMKLSLSTIPDQFKGTVLKKLAGKKHLLV
jgi:hypothetical protein